MKFLLVDECQSTRDGIKLSLQRMGNTEVVGETNCPQEALRLAAETPPDFAVIDPEFGSTDCGRLESRKLNTMLCRELKGALDSLHLVAYTFHDTPVGVAYLMLAGADSYVYKGLDLEKLEEARANFRNGERVLMFGPRTWDAAVVIEIIAYLNQLSEREEDVFDLLLRGYTRDEAAEKLYISANTVRNHTRSIFRKCEVRSLNQLYEKFLR